MSVRSMMKQKGRKEVDIKALKEAKRAKLTQLAKENELKERKLQKEKEREILDTLAKSKPQTTHAMAPPPTKRVLPPGFFDAVKPPSPAPINKLPDGFFDTPQTETLEESKEQSTLGGLVGYGSDSDSSVEENEIKTDNQPTSQDNKISGTSAHELPEGFFDNAVLDMKARGIEPEAAATEQKAAEIEEFMNFAEKVGEASAEMDEVSSNVAEDTVRMSSVEQALYMNRVAKIMKDADKEADHFEGGDLTTDNVETIELSANESDALKVKREVEGLVISRKKKKKAAEKAAADGEYLPLDPTNWRTKMI